MCKYDFGEKIVEGSTLDWAKDIVERKSHVLELGASVGTLAKYLKEEKECNVDIVEIDLESGIKAKEYSDVFCIGEMEGDLERDIWYRKIRNRRYDYIVILDVLEHLKNSGEVLKKAVTLLKEDGVIALSIPNIAHNSVIIDLINNKFEYTPLGLLDNTHIHFFTYQSACEMIKSCGLEVINSSSIQLRVGENEIANNYSDIDKNIEKQLRIRELADVYQFLFVAAKKKSSRENLEFLPDNLDYTLYKMESYVDGQFYKNYFVNPFEINVEITVEDVEGKELRIDPLEFNCLLKNIEIIGIYQDGNSKVLKITKTNGIHLNEEELLFLDNDPQIYMNLQKEINKVVFRAQTISFDEILLNKIGQIWFEKSNLLDVVRKQESIIQEYMLKINN